MNLERPHLHVGGICFLGIKTEIPKSGVIRPEDAGCEKPSSSTTPEREKQGDLLRALPHPRPPARPSLPTSSALILPGVGSNASLG